MMMYKGCLLLIGCLLIGISAQGQRKVSPYTQHRLHEVDSLQTRLGDTDDTLVKAFIYTQGTPDCEALKQLGVKVNQVLDGILTVQIPLQRLTEIEALDCVKYIQAGLPVKQMMNKARAVAGVDKVHSGEGLAGTYTGKGVVVGVVDAGFDYTHPNFYDSERNELRIKRVWEQDYDKGTPPEGFTYGGELKTTEEILNAGGDLTSNTHGTHVAGIAAGADCADGNPYYGVAGDADIVLVSMDMDANDNVCISDAVAYIYNYAESVGKPCVINLSLGTQIGPHDGTSPFDQVTDRLQGNGRLLVGSLGNFGADRLHLFHTFTSVKDTLCVMTDYKVKPTASTVGGSIDIWAEVGMSFDIKVVIVNEREGAIEDETPFLSATTTEGATLEATLTNDAKGTILMTSEVNPLNGKTHVLITPKLTSLRNYRSLGVIIAPHKEGSLHAWTDGGYIVFSETSLDGWTMGDKEYTLAELGGTGKNIISVGAYTSADTYLTEGSSVEKTTGETLGALASFSALGPTVDGRMKPDIAAPGTFIASSVSSHYNALSTLPLASSIIWNEASYNYAYMQGTSMSAPFVTGVLATWLQANPNLTPDNVRDILSRTSVTDEYTTSPNAWGYGKIDAYAGLKECVALAAGVGETDMKNDCVISVGEDCVRLFFGQNISNVVIALYDIQGNKLYADENERVFAGDEIVIPTKNLGRGVYMLRVNGDTYKFVKGGSIN